VSNAGPSRIEEARQRASVAKQAAVALAVAGFLAVLLLARASHAGTNNVSSTSGSTPSPSSTDSSTQSSDGFDYGSPSVAPSTATPQAQTSVS
jgi:hypothetical protein